LVTSIPTYRGTIQRTKRPPSDDDVSIVLQLLDSHRAYDYCQQMAQERVEEALAELALVDVKLRAWREFEAVVRLLLHSHLR
jgi:geranylgeranyl pyrophosphate synthase